LPPDLRFGEFEVDRAAELLRRHGEVVHLEPRSFRLLVYLLDHRDRLVTKQDLNESVWEGAFVTDNAVDRLAGRLAARIPPVGHRRPDLLRTGPVQGRSLVVRAARLAVGPA
jgi:DNA-binding winged helix-turn-helix (wHTH) protein